MLACWALREKCLGAGGRDMENEIQVNDTTIMQPMQLHVKFKLANLNNWEARPSFLAEMEQSVIIA